MAPARVDTHVRARVGADGQIWPPDGRAICAQAGEHVRARRHQPGIYRYGLYSSYGLYTYGLCSYGLYCYGVYSYGLGENVRARRRQPGTSSRP